MLKARFLIAYNSFLMFSRSQGREALTCQQGILSLLMTSQPSCRTASLERSAQEDIFRQHYYSNEISLHSNIKSSLTRDWF